MLIALNRFIVGKDSVAIAKYNHRFENVDVSMRDLADHVSGKGHAFCAQHTGSRRSSAFTAAGFLAVDIDHGLTIESAEADPFFQAYAGMLYTTASHTPEHHRFRIVFELAEPITDGERMRLALTGLAARFGGDKACTDPCRLFFGNPGCEVRIYD